MYGHLYIWGGGAAFSFKEVKARGGGGSFTTEHHRIGHWLVLVKYMVMGVKCKDPGDFPGVSDSITFC